MIGEKSVASEEITIEAPAQLVWDVIVDFDNYHLWNAFCPGMEARLEVGAPVLMKVDLGNGLQDQVEYITAIEAPHRIVWSMENRPGDPIHANRTQVVTPLDDARCTYWTVDEFDGEMVPDMMAAMGAQMERGFNLCAQGLKARAEALYRGEA